MLEVRRRTLEELRRVLLERARTGRNPFEYPVSEGMRGQLQAEMEAALFELSGLDHESWAEPFARRGAQHEALAADSEGHAAADEWLAAYALYRVARYPAPSSSTKAAAYDRARHCFLMAASLAEHPLERVELAFSSPEPGRSRCLPVYLRLPSRPGPHPTLVMFGGIDYYKEELRPEPFLDAGWAVVLVDMPGVGESPLVGSETAERLFDPVFDFIADHDDLDPTSVAVLGMSAGGYWATKLAHTHASRIRAAVNHGGPVHHVFSLDWIQRSQNDEYPLELHETFAWCFGRSGLEDWAEFAPRMSLLEQGVLDMDSAPLLYVNGAEDRVCPPHDLDVMLEHGAPVSARVFARGGHMGWPHNPQPTILSWLSRQLGVSASRRFGPGA